jgi:lipopolysaccharide export system permease protein
MKLSVFRHNPIPSTLLRYFRKELYKAISFVMMAFVGLFAFFDLITEVDRLSMPNTSWVHYFAAVLLGLPARVYEIAPIAALVGSIYALVQIAANSEFTAMRAAGLSTVSMLKIVSRVALGIALLTVFFGEVVAPAAERAAVPLRAKALGYEVNKDFRSGYWLRDTFTTNDNQKGARFVNFASFNNDGELSQVEFYELDADSRIRKWVRAGSAAYQKQGFWMLKNVKVQGFFDVPVSNPEAAAAGLTIHAGSIEHADTMRWDSTLSPQFLTGLFVQPERMSAWQLRNYSNFLKSNLQAADEIDLAFAKKVMYPFAILIMMMISLPFAYLHFRSGGVSVKVFAGIMIGVAFHLINNLFSHLGMMTKAPPFLSASLPTLIGFVVGMAALWWVGQPAPWRMLSLIKAHYQQMRSSA